MPYNAIGRVADFESVFCPRSNRSGTAIAASDKSGRTDFESGGKGAVPLAAAITRDGRVWLITVVLKTTTGKTVAGSNPALSATIY